MTSLSRAIALLVSGAAIAAFSACGGGSSERPASPAASDGIGATATAARAGQDSRIRFLETRSAGDPLDVFSLNSLAIEHLQRLRETGNIAEQSIAETALGRSLKIQPRDNYDGIALLASVDVIKHDFAAALDLAQQAIAQKPKNAFGYGVLGDADMGLGRYDDADAAYERAVTLEPDLSAFGRRALLFAVRGNFDEAEQSWKETLARAEGDGVPEHSGWAHAQLGNLYVSEGRLDDADKQYAASLDAFPGYVHALAGAARVAGARSDYAAAIDYYTRAVNTVPLPEYVIALGDVYAASGDDKRSRQEYDLIAAIQQLYQANGVNLDLQIALFNADHDRDIAATVERAKKVYGEQPSVAAADVLAWVQFRAGNIGEARTAIDQALRTGNRDPLVLFHAGMIYRAANDRDAAKRYLQMLEDQAPHFSVLYEGQARDALDELNRAG